MNRIDARLQAQTLELRGTVASNSTGLVLSVPDEYNLGHCFLYAPSFPTTASLPFRIQQPKTPLEFQEALAHYVSQLRDILDQHRHEVGAEKIEHDTVKIPLVVSMSYSRHGVGHTAFQLYDLYCDVRWNLGDPEPKLQVSLSGFRCVEDITSQVKPGKNGSDEFVNNRWVKRKKDFAEELGK